MINRFRGPATPGRRSGPLAILALAVAFLCPSAVYGAGDVNQAQCANETATGYQASLPDCRAYELVSPSQASVDVATPKEVLGSSVPFAGSADSSAVAYAVAGGLAGSSSVPGYTNNLAVKGSGGGWVTTPLSPPSVLFPGDHSVAGEVVYWSPDLSCAIEFTDQPLTPEAVATTAVTNLYAWHSDGEYTLLTDVVPANASSTTSFYVDAATPDCEKILFETDSQLLPGAPSEGKGLYEWADGTLRLAAEGLPLAPLQSGGTGNPEAGSGSNSLTVNTLSDDGATTFISAEAVQTYYLPPAVREEYERINEEIEKEGGTELLPTKTVPVRVGEVYARVNGAASKVSGSQKTNGAGHEGRDTAEPSEARFQAASDDGERVFFTSRTELTNDANTGTIPGVESFHPGTDLYEYDLKTGTLSDLSVDNDPADSETGADVQGVLGTSTDGEYVYFSALGQLLGGEGNTLAQNQQEEEVNVYLAHEGRLSFIATVNEGGAEVDRTTHVDTLESRVTPDGRYLVFAAANEVTGYDNRDAESGLPDKEIYEYSASGGSVSCVSCDPDGVRPVAATEFVPGQIYDGHIPRNLSADGSVFFSSAAGLVASAENGVDDVYEYAGGHLYLLNDASGSAPSEFAEAGANGEDLYITTHEALVQEARSGLRVLYDVRVSGGSPRAAQSPAPCSEDDCQGPPPPSGSGSVSATSVAGPSGNVPAQAPPRPKARPLTRAQKLKKALAVCRGDKRKSRRQSCERRARKQYGPGKPKASGR